jgi:hypothetical protein
MKLASALYFLFALFLFVHCLRYNNYSTDTAEFVGNVVAIQTTDPVLIHHITYEAIMREAPPMVVPHILGNDSTTNEAAVRRNKYADPYHFAQFLPYFSVKPLYIESLYLTHKMGVGLVRSIAVVSALSFLGLAALIYLWLLRIGGSVWIGCLILFIPEVLGLGQETGPDGLSLLLLVGALFGLFHARPSFGIALLMLSIWVRPDNAILAALVLAYLTLRGTVRSWMALILIGISLMTPVVVAHFGGGYGWKALYSHTFKFTEMSPGEFLPTFTLADYFRALLSGTKGILKGNSILYILLWIIGYKLVPKMRSVLVLCALFAISKFLIYPNFEWRYYAVLYLMTAITVSVAIKECPTRPFAPIPKVS